MSIKSAIVDIRKMKRSVKMREETDPEVVANTLETILKESIALQANRGGIFERGAVNELKQVRNALAANQIDAGSRSAEFVGKFSMVLDQLDQEREEQRKTIAEGTFNSFTNNLPSLETLTSAVITANPVVGYGMKILGDMSKGRKESRNRAREESKKRLKMLEERESAISAQMENEQQRSDLLEGQDTGQQEGDENQSPILQQIREEIIRLREELSGNQERLNKIVEPISGIDTVNNNIEKLTEENSNNLERLTDNEEEQTRLRRDNANAQEFNALESNIEGQGTTNDSNLLNDRDKERGGLPVVGLFGRMSGMLGGILGAAGGLAVALMTPFKKLFGFLKSAGRTITSVGRMSGILTAVISLIDFASGFLNAEEILGKQDVSIPDRLRVGVSSIITGLLQPIDWVMEFFGSDLYTGSRDELTAKLANGMSDLVDNVVKWSKETFNKVIEWFKDSFNSIVDGVKQIGQDIDDTVRDWLPDWVTGGDSGEEDSNPRQYGQGGAMQRQELRQRRLQEENQTRPADSVSENLNQEQTNNVGGNTVINAPNNVNNVNQVNGDQPQKVPDSRSNESVFRRFNNRASYMGWSY